MQSVAARYESIVPFIIPALVWFGGIWIWQALCSDVPVTWYRSTEPLLLIWIRGNLTSSMQYEVTRSNALNHYPSFGSAWLWQAVKSASAAHKLRGTSDTTYRGASFSIPHLLLLCQSLWLSPSYVWVTKQQIMRRLLEKLQKNFSYYCIIISSRNA